MRKLKNITLAVLCLCVLSFCKRANTTWADDVVAPLATGSLSLGNLFPDTVIKANGDSTLKISFTSNLINYRLDSLLKIPDTTTTYINTLPGAYPFGVAIGPSQTFFSVTSTDPTAETNYSLPNGIQLKKAIVRQGSVAVKLQNTVRQPLIYHYQLISATKNNAVLDTSFYIPGNSTINTSINLVGYSIDFSGINHNKSNTIIQTYTIGTSSNAQNDSIFGGQGLIANFTFHQLVPQYALGYFGSQSITVGPDTAAFTVFNSIKQGMLNLNSANVSLNISNEFGVDMSATISNLSSINTNIPNTVNLSATPLNSPIHLSSATNTGSGAITTLKNIVLNNSNSNVKDFIGNLPGKLSYKLKAQLNPNGNFSGSNDFGYYGTSFSAMLNMDVPLYFSASSLMLADTVMLNLSNISQLQNINHGNLILTATNSYPFSINLNAVLLDEYKHPIDYLFSSPNLIEAPLLDATGKVIEPLKSRLYVPLTPQKITNLQKARYVSYTATFNTANQPTQVKFYSNYTLDLLLTADLNYTIGK